MEKAHLAFEAMRETHRHFNISAAEFFLELGKTLSCIFKKARRGRDEDVPLASEILLDQISQIFTRDFDVKPRFHNSYRHEGPEGEVRDHTVEGGAA